MKGSIRVSAKTLDDAITEALIQLGVTDLNIMSLKKEAQVFLESV